MATTNFSKGVNQITLTELVCTVEFAEGLQNQLIFLSVLNVLLSIIAFLGNTLILVALHKESSLHAPSKLLFRCLATTDFSVGLIAGPLKVIYWISTVKEQWNICRFMDAANFITGCILCAVSLFTLTAISMDRLQALLLGLRYRQVVTLKRTNAMIILFWIISIVGTLFSFWKKVILSLCIYTCISLCLVISIYSHTKIFYTLRHRQHQVQDNDQRQPGQTIPPNIPRYRRTVSSVLWVQLTLVIFYLPFFAVEPLTNYIAQSASASAIRHFLCRFFPRLKLSGKALNI